MPGPSSAFAPRLAVVAPEAADAVRLDGGPERLLGRSHQRGHLSCRPTVGRRPWSRRGRIGSGVTGLAVRDLDPVDGSEPRGVRRQEAKGLAGRDGARVREPERRLARERVESLDERRTHVVERARSVRRLRPLRGGRRLHVEGRRNGSDAVVRHRPVHERSDEVDGRARRRDGRSSGRQRRVLLHRERPVPPLGRRVQVDRQLRFRHAPERVDGAEAVGAERHDPSDPLPVRLDALGQAAAVRLRSRLPRRNRQQRGEPAEVEDVGEVEHCRVVRLRRPERRLAQLSCAEEERIEQGAVGERKPVRLHHERRIGAEPVERVRGSDEREREQAPAPEQYAEARGLEAVGEGGDRGADIRHDRGLRTIAPSASRRCSSSAQPGPGTAPCASRSSRTGGGDAPFRSTKSAPSPRAWTANGIGSAPRTSRMSAGRSGRSSGSTSSPSGL